MNEIIGAIKEIAGIIKVWISSSEKRRKSALNRSIEQMFDLIEKKELTDKLFIHYKKRIRAYL